jgi:hypothetical protein
MQSSFSLISCQQDSVGSSPFKAKVVTRSQGEYGLKVVTIKTLNSIDTLDGSIAVVKGNASLDISAASSDVVTSDNPDRLYSHKGESINLDYEVKDGIVIPRNFDSMSMLTAYYHFEKIFTFWQQNFDLSLEKFSKTRIFIDPKIEVNQDGVSASGTLKINAAFIPGPRDFWLFKTSPIEKIPLKMNLGVLAHEFTHSIFDLYFAEKDPSFYDSEDTNSSYILSAINEGLADYFSWVVTGDTDEFNNSLDAFKKNRTLPVEWTIKDVVTKREGSKSSEQGTQQCEGSFYCEGSVLASALYEISFLEGNTPVSVGKIVLTSLSALRDDWIATKKTGKFDHDKLINQIQSRLQINTSESCQIFKNRFNTKTLLEGIEC